jgi:hypothetical protein
MSICLRLNLIIIITKEWLHKRKSDTYVTSHIQNTQKNGQPVVHHITTVASSCSHNISNIELWGHYLPQKYLQPQHQCLHGCEVNHIRTSERMSSPLQQ